MTPDWKERARKVSDRWGRMEQTHPLTDLETLIAALAAEAYEAGLEAAARANDEGTRQLACGVLRLVSEVRACVPEGQIVKRWVEQLEEEARIAISALRGAKGK